MGNKDIVKTEQNFIYLLLHHKELVNDWLESSLEKEHFSKKHQLILKAIEDAYAKDVKLTRKGYKKFISNLLNPKQKIEQESVYNNCYASIAKKDDFPVLLNEILEDYLLKKSAKEISRFTSQSKERGVIVALNNFVDNLNNLSLDISNSESLTYYDNISTVGYEHMEYIDKVRKGEIKEPPIISTGYKEIDETMVTGLAAGTLTLITADVGCFKSVMMLNIALNVSNQGYKVLFVPIEMPKEQVVIRALSNEAKIPSNKLLKKDYTDEDYEKIQEVLKKWEEQNNLYVMQNQGNTTVSSIKRQIDKHIDLFNPDLVVIDYMDNLDADKARDGRYDLEIADMLKNLRMHGRDLGFGVVSGAQLGRKALERIRKTGVNKDKGTINSEDIRGAHSFSMWADYILAQNPNSSQPNGLLDIFVVKSRNGKKMFSNGSLKATLEIFPDICTIKSSTDFDLSSEGVLEKASMYEEEVAETNKGATSVFDEIVDGDADEGDVDDFDYVDF